MISTPAVLDTCRRCGSQILTGHSEGLLVRADAAPLDSRQELIVLLAGRATYDLQLMGLPRKPYLMHRHSFRIQAARKWGVVADHRCPPGTHFPAPAGPPIDLVISYATSNPRTPPF